jgi:phosphohistidine phosphatase SixA/8-oxo-dGTP pyrophosphatase MutT (NUDIX family)
MSIVVSAAGTILIRNNEVLIVHRPRYDDWSFPKGKADGAELLPLAAIRECDEETGFLAVLGPNIGVDRYEIPQGKKEVHYWRAHVLEDLGFAPDEEVDKVAWIPVDQVAKHLSYAQDLEFLDRAMALPPTSPLIILRHAKAVKRSDFTGKDDGDRPLSGRGRRQSKIITEVLEGYGIEQIISSPMRRCQETVKKYVKQLSATPALVDAISEWGYEQNPEHLDPAIELAMHDPAPTVLCSHRPVLDAILDTVARLGGIPKSERKEGIWSTKLSPGSFVVVHRAFQLNDPVRNSKISNRVTIVATEHHEVPGNQEP